jgi:hypothetical protein
MLRFSCCRTGPALVGLPGLPLVGERLFFALVKFIMCLKVAEVKVVPCAPELVVQVLELHKKIRFFLTFLKAPEQPFPHPWNALRAATFSPPEAA